MGVAAAIVMQVGLTAIQWILIYLAARVILQCLYRWRALRLVVDTMKLAFPRFGLVHRNLAAARWARSFAALWGAGVNISTAIEVASRTTLNARYERDLQAAALQTRLGRPLSESLSTAKLLPAHLISIIMTCEMVGSLDSQLLKLATQMESEALARAIEEMNKLVIAAQIIFLVVAVGGVRI